MNAVMEIRIGVLVELTRAFGRDLCAGITAYAQRHEGLSPFFIDMKTLNNPSSLSRFDGFIARVMTDDIARRLSATKKPVVDTYYEKPRPGFAIAKVNHAHLGRMAAEYFLDRKFTAFGFCGFAGGRFSDYCRQSFCRALSAKGIFCHCFEPHENIRYEFDQSVLINERLNHAPDTASLSKWIKTIPKPIAIFCPNDLRAWQLLQICNTCKIRVPQDVSILGLDNDILVCGFSKPMLSSIDPNTMEIGQMATRTLVEMIEKPSLATKPIVRQIDPLGVVERASTETYPVNPSWLSDALVFIKKHVADHLTASDVYAHLNRSHTSVDAAFQKTFGATVQKTIAATRIETARHLLRTTDFSIIQIAERSGFASQEYFSRSFSAATGMSPGVWRSQTRKKDRHRAPEASA